jgi:hypothetical protein
MAHGQCIATLLAQRHVTIDEERDVSIFIVGTGSDPALDRIVKSGRCKAALLARTIDHRMERRIESDRGLPIRPMNV